MLEVYSTGAAEYNLGMRFCSEFCLNLCSLYVYTSEMAARFYAKYDGDGFG